MAQVKIPARLLKAVEACPAVQGRVQREKILAKLLAGKLDDVAAKYAERAADEGTEGDFWEVWLEIQRTRKLAINKSINELASQQRRWLGLWCFQENRDPEGIAAYRKFLDDPGGIGPFAPENTKYLDALLRAGRDDEVLATVSELEAQAGELTWEQTRVAQVQYAKGQTRKARRTLDSLVDQDSNDAQLHGQVALVFHRLGETAKAREILERALPKGIFYEPLVAELRAAFSLSEQAWESLAAGKASGFDLEQLARQWWHNPGAQLLASKRATPHTFGGQAFKTTKCKGCGHPIRQWFSLDIREIPSLHEQLPSWTLLPLLGCVDCMVWMGRHDYEVDLEKRRAKLVKVTLPNIKKYSAPQDALPGLPMQYARIKARKPKKRLTEKDQDAYLDLGPTVGGAVPWLEAPQEVSCRRCKAEMTFVAAMASVTGFDTHLPINNESGYQYHFACDDCHTISVIAQWS